MYFKFVFNLSPSSSTYTSVRLIIDDVTINKWCKQIEQIYEARRDSTTNPLDHVFELCGYSWSLLPGQTYKCKIYYRPFVPFTVNVDYFTIVDSAGERAEIQVRGICIGNSFSINGYLKEKPFTVKAYPPNSESPQQCTLVEVKMIDWVSRKPNQFFFLIS